jgi:uncharacterized membrane protein
MQAPVVRPHEWAYLVIFGVLSFTYCFWTGWIFIHYERTGESIGFVRLRQTLDFGWLLMVGALTYMLPDAPALMITTTVLYRDVIEALPAPAELELGSSSAGAPSGIGAIKGSRPAYAKLGDEEASHGAASSRPRAKRGWFTRGGR